MLRYVHKHKQNPFTTNSHYTMTTEVANTLNWNCLMDFYCAVCYRKFVLVHRRRGSPTLLCSSLRMVQPAGSSLVPNKDCFLAPLFQTCNLGNGSAKTDEHMLMCLVFTLNVSSLFLTNFAFQAVTCGQSQCRLQD